MTDARTPRVLMVGSVLLITIAAFENLAATTILPVVARELDGFALYALAAGVPLAAHVAASAIGGVIVDASGFGRPLAAGIITSAAGLLLAGLAPSMWVLALGRGIAGFGIGLVIVALYAAVGLLVPAARRASYFAAFSASWVVPSMVGPAIAGLLADAGLWRWVFLAAVPLFLACLFVFGGLLRADVRPRHIDRGAVRGRFLRIGPVALTLAVALTVLQASVAEKADGQIATMTGAIISGLLVLVVVPLLLPRGTPRFRVGVPAAIATRLLVNGAIIGSEAFIPLFLQEERGWTPAASGLVLTVGSITWALGAAIQTRATSDRAQRTIIPAGAVMLVAALLLVMMLTGPEMPVVALPFVWGIAGLGVGTTYPALAVFALEHTSLGKQGEVSASLQIADGVGAAVSIALFGLVLTLTGGHFGHGFLVMTALGVISVLSALRVRKPTSGEPPSIADLH